MAQGLSRLAQMSPPERDAPSASTLRNLSRREKAAVIVRLMLAEGSPLALSALPEQMQASIAEQIGHMRLVDRGTVGAVVDEFLGELEDVGLSFPSGIEGALSMMDGHISEPAATRLRRLAGASSRSDPWDRLVAMPAERLLPVLETESVEVAAVMISKFPAAKSADLLSRLPGERARRVAYAVSLTGNVDPETVRRIGLSLAAQLETQPPRAFDVGPVERVGAILNIAAQGTRDAVLAGLEETDAAFASQVRRAIFTYVHIPARLEARDVPKVVRLVDPALLATAFAASQAAPDTAAATEFILAGMSQRMAQGLRDEMATRGAVRPADGEAAMNAVIAAIRDLMARAEIVLVQAED